MMTETVERDVVRRTVPFAQEVDEGQREVVS